jgi:ribosome maturation factor RimP
MYTDALQLEDELDKMLYDYGFQLADLQVMGRARGRTFRLFLDRVDGAPVTLADCAALSPQIELFLQSKRIYNEQCLLEVSSAGLDRVLKRDRDFERFLGSEIRVTFFVEGQRKTIEGELSSFTDEVLVVTPPPVKGEVTALQIERRNVERVHLVPHVEIGKR